MMKHELIIISLFISILFSCSNSNRSVAIPNINSDAGQSSNDQQGPVVKKLKPTKGIFMIEGKEVRLKRGVSKVPQGMNSATLIITRYTGINAKGDINNDGKDDIAVILTYQPGGSGTFYYASVIYSVKDGYRSTNTFFIGDRINVSSIEIIDGGTKITYLDRGKGESMTTTPTLIQSKNLEFKTGILSEVKEKVTITGRVWTWQKTIMNNDELISPEEKEAFSLLFDPEGRITITTDCNNYSGSFKIDGNRVSLGKLMSTKKYCEGSQENVFIRSLTEADTFFINEMNQLVMMIKFDSGSMIFY